MTYEIRENDGLFFVGHFDESGEWFDTDQNPFISIDDAEKFRDEIQNEQDSIE